MLWPKILAQPKRKKHTHTHARANQQNTKQMSDRKKINKACGAHSGKREKTVYEANKITEKIPLESETIDGKAVANTASVSN